MKFISQQTYDDVVLENVKEFGMSIEEAIHEASKEFDAQGVHLLNIVKTPRLSEDGDHIIHDVLLTLENIKTKCDDSDRKDLKQLLGTFVMQCKTSLPHRLIAANNGAYPVLLSLVDKSQNDTSLFEVSLHALISVTTGNPDILTDEGKALLLTLLEQWQEKEGGEKVAYYLSRWSYESCLKHEQNRQDLLAAGVPSHLVILLKTNMHNGLAVRAACRALRAFVLDDDIRAEFGKAHDHARALVEEHGLVAVCLEALPVWMNDSETASELLSTLSRLCVRAEYCQESVDKGALKIINDVLVSFTNNQGLIRQAVSLLKTVSGNDDVKREAMKNGSSQLVIGALMTHQTDSGVCEACCGALAMLALRAPNHAQQMVQEGAAQAVLQAMNIHPMHKPVQKMGCLAVRNMVSRCPENSSAFLECGAKEVIGAAVSRNLAELGDMGRAALRDMGLDMVFNEAWKGTGFEIERD